MYVCRAVRALQKFLEYSCLRVTALRASHAALNFSLNQNPIIVEMRPRVHCTEDKTNSILVLLRADCAVRRKSINYPWVRPASRTCSRRRSNAGTGEVDVVDSRRCACLSASRRLLCQRLGYMICTRHDHGQSARSRRCSISSISSVKATALPVFSCR